MQGNETRGSQQTPADARVGHAPNQFTMGTPFGHGAEQSDNMFHDASRMPAPPAVYEFEQLQRYSYTLLDLFGRSFLHVGRTATACF
jgi:hypothetical protein